MTDPTNYCLADPNGKLVSGRWVGEAWVEWTSDEKPLIQWVIDNDVEYLFSEGYCDFELGWHARDNEVLKLKADNVKQRALIDELRDLNADYSDDLARIREIVER